MDITGGLERMDDEPSQNLGTDRVKLELERRDHAEVPSPATNPPEQIRVLVLVHRDKLPGRCHDLRGNEIVCRQPVLPAEPSETTPQRESRHAGRRVDSDRRSEAVDLGLTIDNSLGSRSTATFMKLPTDAPKASAKMIKGTSWNMESGFP